MYVITLDPDSPEYLEHFGVLGMHWGVRNSETQRKYDGGQKHSEARTDIAKPTKGHAYKGEFKPTLSKDQTKMLKRAAAGVAIGAGIAAGVTIGAKSGVLKTVAKNGARKLATTAVLQARGKAFADKVRTGSAKTVKKAANSMRTPASRRALANELRGKKTALRNAAVSKRTTFKNSSVKRYIDSGKNRIWNGKRMAPIRKANATFDYYTKDPKGKKKAGTRLALGASGAAMLSLPIVEGHDIDRRTLRRANGRHASTKWMRNNERRNEGRQHYV